MVQRKCPTCQGQYWNVRAAKWVSIRETVDMVCQTCGRNYMDDDPQPNNPMYMERTMGDESHKNAAEDLWSKNLELLERVSNLEAELADESNRADENLSASRVWHEECQRWRETAESATKELSRLREGMDELIEDWRSRGYAMYSGCADELDEMRFKTSL